MRFLLLFVIFVNSSIIKKIPQNSILLHSPRNWLKFRTHIQYISPRVAHAIISQKKTTSLNRRRYHWPIKSSYFLHRWVFKSFLKSRTLIRHKIQRFYWPILESLFISNWIPFKDDNPELSQYTASVTLDKSLLSPNAIHPRLVPN